MKPKKRPARWLAFLLNLVCPPAGYVYAGALRWAVGTVVALVLGSGIAMVWTINAPPGLYASIAPGWSLFELAPVIGLGLAIHAAVLAGRPGRRLSLWPAVAVVGVLWLSLLALAQAVRAFAPIATYTVASESMAPSLAVGDVLLSSGDRTLCGDAVIAPGDIVFFRDGRGVIYSHRAVAGPGQTVEMRAGRLFIDGRAVERRPVRRQPSASGSAEVFRETLSNGRSYLTMDFGPRGALDDSPVTRLPADHWFVLGDSRDNAVDSRVRGPVATTDICGVAVRILSASDPERIGTRP
jgi:signal peptidase I